MLHQRRCGGQTTDKEQEKNKHTKHWQQVVNRLVTIVQCLTERNLALRGIEENVGNDSVHNGNVLCLVELLRKFDSALFVKDQYPQNS